MPLNTAGLQEDLQELFSDPPDTTAACAASWASLMESYTQGVVPASTTVSVAAGALETALLSAFQSETTAEDMETAFTAFATTVGTGMSPAFVATPPPGQVGFLSSFGVVADSHSTAAANYATLIDTWMRTGTATPSAGGSPVNWN